MADPYSFWDLEQIPLFLFWMAAFRRIVKYSSTCLARAKFTTTFSFHSQNMSKPRSFLLVYRLSMAPTRKWWVLALRRQWCCCLFKFLRALLQATICNMDSKSFCVWPSDTGNISKWARFFCIRISEPLSISRGVFVNPSGTPTWESKMDKPMDFVGVV